MDKQTDAQTNLNWRKHGTSTSKHKQTNTMTGKQQVPDPRSVLENHKKTHGNLPTKSKTFLPQNRLMRPAKTGMKLAMTSQQPGAFCTRNLAPQDIPFLSRIPGETTTWWLGQSLLSTDQKILLDLQRKLLRRKQLRERWTKQLTNCKCQRPSPADYALYSPRRTFSSFQHSLSKVTNVQSACNSHYLLIPRAGLGKHRSKQLNRRWNQPCLSST